MDNSMSYLSAADIVPHAYEEGDSDDNEDRVDDLIYDVYNLVACDYHAIKEVNDEVVEENLLASTQRATQLLINRCFKFIYICVVCFTFFRLFSLPYEKTEVGPAAVLPKETFIYPREKKIPEPKGETKWEKFAKEKGIKNKKKDRMLFDEDTQEYRPRYGYKRANNIEDQVIVEVKPGQDPYANPWEVARADKKQRVEKNEKQRIKNIERNSGVKKSKKIPQNEFETSKSISGIPIDIEKKVNKGKDRIRSTLQLVQHSTASLGRFDPKRIGEPERKIKGKKRSFEDNVGNDTLSTEKVIVVL